MSTPVSSRRRAMLLGTTLVVASALLLTGCGRSADAGPTDGDAATVDTKPATGTLDIWTQGADGAKLPDMFAEFKKDNPDVDVKMTEVPEGEFQSKLTAAITAGTTPDLLYAFTETQSALIATGGFDAVPDGLVDSGDFYDSIWNNSVVDGVAYGVPWYAYANVFMYRTDLVDAAGAEVPKDWNGVIDFAKKLKASGVEYPLSLSANYDQYAAQQLAVAAAQNGGAMISDDLKTWTIDSPQNVEALDFWASLMKDGYASQDGPAFLDTVPWMTQGKNAAIWDGGPWFASWFDDANGDGWGAEHIGYALNPVGPAGDSAATMGGGSWMVPSDSGNKDAAWKFTRWMSAPEQQVQWYKIFKNMPAVKAAWDDPALKGDLLDVVRESLESGVNRPSVSTWTQVGNMIGEQMEKVVRGGVSAKDALTDAQKQAEQIGTGN